MKDLNWFDQNNLEFVYKNRKGSKKGSCYKKARSALGVDDELSVLKTQFFIYFIFCADLT